MICAVRRKRLRVEETLRDASFRRVVSLEGEVRRLVAVGDDLGFIVQRSDNLQLNAGLSSVNHHIADLFSCDTQDAVPLGFQFLAHQPFKSKEPDFNTGCDL